MTLTSERGVLNEQKEQHTSRKHDTGWVYARLRFRQQIKETKKELVRQRDRSRSNPRIWILAGRYGARFSIGGRKKVDVAIFHHGKEHIIENLGRAVLAVRTERQQKCRTHP
ncbi:hypothetical protein [Pluralibacter gergoviae]|uniref:hypothetical protein n=1 Tax=Pluralibacter gergoviae TaxID=61647 RepID=UPI001EF0CC58|nr:hypothetical protein [Pluralibacter gergoviae]